MTKKEMQMHAVKIRRIFTNTNPPVDGTNLDAALQVVNGELCDVCNIIQGSPEEALVFVSLLTSNNRHGISLRQIDDFLKMERHTTVMFLSEAIKALIEKLLVEESNYYLDKSYFLTPLAVKLVEKDLCYDDVKADVKKERRTLRYLFAELSNAIWDSMDSSIEECSKRVFACLSNHKHWIFSNNLLNIRDEFSSTEWVLFVWLMTNQTYTGADSVDIEPFLKRYDFGGRRNYEILKNTKLGIDGYISSNDELWTSKIKVSITQLAWQEFLSDEFPFMRRIIEGPALKEVSKASITSRRLFYNRDLEKDLNTLNKIMKLGRFEDFCKKQSRAGNKGKLTILFDGPPGTGKTEFVQQLAVKSGRLLMMVDIAQIRSKWVGDSEKNIAALFEDYARAKANNGYAPIMLLDEADAIISRRFGVNNSVDQMSNSMQNLLLQHIERMEGILIATTNLRDNMDAAFERRFLLKMKFAYPDNETRMHILKNKLGLDNSDAEVIASLYSFTGADIENVVQKLSMMKFLGKRIKSDVVMQQLHQDLQLLSGRKQIGFSH